MKKFLVVGLFLIITLSLTACKKEEEILPEVDPNYAINETKESEDDTEESLEVENTNNSTEESNDDSTVTESNDQIYNVKPDTYANDIKDMSTISIDGKLIGFPCSYQYVTDIFGQLTTITYNSKFGDMHNPVNETITATSFEVFATPTTGEGRIMFTFTSSNGAPTTITEMTCSEVLVQGGNTNGNEVMTFALPQNITFGSTLDNILDVYGTDNVTHTESQHNASEYRIRFVYEDLKQCYEFTGHDNGLYIAKINYNYTETK